MPATPLLPGLEDYKPTPQLLDKVLAELDITNNMAAELAGVTHSTMNRWLSGESPINRGCFRLFLMLCFLKRGQSMLRVSWSTPEGAGDDETIGNVVAVAAGDNAGRDDGKLRQGSDA